MSNGKYTHRIGSNANTWSLLAIRESCEITSIWLLISNYSSPFSSFYFFQSFSFSSLANTCRKGIAFVFTKHASYISDTRAGFPFIFVQGVASIGRIPLILSENNRASSSVHLFLFLLVYDQLTLVFIYKKNLLYKKNSVDRVSIIESFRFLFRSRNFFERNFCVDRLFCYKLFLGRKLQIEEIVSKSIKIIDFIFSRKKLR